MSTTANTISSRTDGGGTRLSSAHERSGWLESRGTRKRLLMCPPDHFDVVYEINHWMHKHDAVDVALARTQWQALHDVYRDLGYDVESIEGVPGLPDMVFTANGGLVIDGKAALPRFRHPERQGETERFDAWFRAQGFETFLPEHDFEGEGDCLYAGGVLFAGSGYRTDPRSHAELAEFFDCPVVSLRQIDPRFYHLDVAMCPVTDDTLMYYPGAFDEPSRRALCAHFPRLLEASERDAVAFGLNAISDGENVVLSSLATGLVAELRRQGLHTIGLDMSEFRKSGGAVKCCTLELHEDQGR
jgi:N-dimethylarginine dimethylaminohydrolase